VPPEIGVVLPVAPPGTDGVVDTAATLAGTVRSVDAMGYEAVWLRDWPLRAASGGSPPDAATGHDPVAYGAVLRAALPAAVTVGFAVLRLDFREPAVTARSIVSLASLAGGPVAVGLGGPGSADPAERAATTRAYRAVRALLTFREAADFVVPDGFVCPPLLLASRSAQIWEAVGYEAEGVLTTEVHPGRLGAALAALRAVQPTLGAGLECLLKLDEESPGTVARQGPCLVVGRRRLAELARAWIDCGVDRILVHLAPTAAFDEHRRVVEVLVSERERRVAA
jgi:hypothetical protein